MSPVATHYELAGRLRLQADTHDRLAADLASVLSTTRWDQRVQLLTYEADRYRQWADQLIGEQPSS